MSPREPQDGGTAARHRRFRRQAWLLGAAAAGIYIGYLAFMIVKGSGGA